MPDVFQGRLWGPEDLRIDDERDEFQRDKARIVHSSGFRRLQAKTQVMGVGEGDFHRTRLTHSLETAQIAEGLLGCLCRISANNNDLQNWLPSVDLTVASCFAHDLGHPPFGHGGEVALNQRMLAFGGFEGNGQTLRILTRLEKYRRHQGINPTIRLALAILKYPMRYSVFAAPNPAANNLKPPKCYLDTEEELVQRILQPFSDHDRTLFTTEVQDGKPKHRSLDCSLMECADDIAYGVHDLEDIVSRRLVRRDQVVAVLADTFPDPATRIGNEEKGVTIAEFATELFDKDSFDRKMFIGRLVNLFVTSIEVREQKEFDHPLLRYRAGLPIDLSVLLETLQSLTSKLVVRRAEVQQLERRGKRIVQKLFDELLDDPESLIPPESWRTLTPGDTVERKVCDYVAGMTDPYAEKIYRRLFDPGFGSSRDEL
jgi:dGTPase